MEPLRSWKISPRRPFYPQLELHQYYGAWRKLSWSVGDLGLQSYNEDLNERKEDFTNRVENINSSALEWRRIFPIILKFRTTEGARYILNFKYYNSWPSESVLIGRGPVITEVYFVDGEINYVFEQDKSEEILIYISPKLLKLSSRIIGFKRSTITLANGGEGINIDRIY